MAEAQIFHVIPALFGTLLFFSPPSKDQKSDAFDSY
jgi:hypothetical protein